MGDKGRVRSTMFTLVNFILLLSASTLSADSCLKWSNGLHNLTEFDCPTPEDPEHFTQCCGTLKSRYCCSLPEGRDWPDDDWPDFDDHFDDALAAWRIGLIIFGVIFVLTFLTILSCCCLPCCFLAQRRARGKGVVHSLPPGQSAGSPAYVTTGMSSPAQPQGFVTPGSGYPSATSGSAYPTASGYPGYSSMPESSGYPPVSKDPPAYQP